MDIFALATKQKLRFETPQGQLSTEDLWSLPLTSVTGKANLDTIAVGLHKQLKNDGDVSFVDSARKSDTTVQLKFDVVKAVIDDRIAERDAKAVERERAEQKQVILGIIADKENEALRGSSLEELRAAAAKF